MSDGKNKLPDNVAGILAQLGQLSPAEISQLNELVDKNQLIQAPKAKAFLMDQRGNLSSKRFWAFAFGWITLIQVVAFLTWIFLSVALGWHEVQQSLIPLIQYSLTTTGGLSALCLGLTLPEWFAVGK